MKINTERFRILIEPDLTPETLIWGMDRVTYYLDDIPFRRSFDPYWLQVELVSFSKHCEYFQGVRRIFDMRDRRFLWPYELLTFEFRNPFEQMKGPIIIPAFTLGILPSALSGLPTRRMHGSAITSTREFEEMIIDPACRFATTPATAVDLGMCEEMCESLEALPVLGSA